MKKRAWKSDNDKWIRVDNETHKRLKRLSKTEGRWIKALVRIAVKMMLIEIEGRPDK